MIWAVIAILASGLFAGAAVYVSFVEHPARMQCGTELAATEFGPSYHRGARLQVPLALVGMVSGIVVWISGDGWGWLIGGVLLGALIPFTLLIIFPINKRLLDPALDKKSQQAGKLLEKWARLHAVRSAVGLAAFVLFACLLRLRD